MSLHHETREPNAPTASHLPERDATLSATPDETAAPAIPGYEIGEEIGHGGMGVVYRARDTRLNREVALKMILRADAGRASVARFWAEAEVMAAVRHPHVVQVFELGDSDGRPFMAMEFVAGGSLHARLTRGPLAPKEAAELLAKVASGVAAAHELSIVHRDLKPANVLLASDGSPKVTDFGLAKRQAHDLTQTQALMGTPAYMAPEQAAGRAKFVGPQADVWALGVVLYECVAGARPFDADTAEALLSQIRSAEPPPLRAASGSVPRDLDTIVTKCLSKEPEHRYPTAAELAADLARFVRGEPLAARPVGRVERFARWVRRKPAAAAAYGFSSLAVLLALVVVVVFSFWREAESARDEADRLRGVADAGRAEEARLRGIADGALQREGSTRQEIERDRDRLARIGYARNVRLAHHFLHSKKPEMALPLLESTPPHLRGWEYGYLHGSAQEFLARREGINLNLRLQSRIAPGDVDSVSFSRDGSKLVCTHGTSPIRILDATTWATLAELEGHTSPVRWAAFSPDGSKVVTASRRERFQNGAAHVWDVATRKPLLEFRMAERLLLRGPVFSPDGSKILGNGPKDGTTCVWDARTGKVLLELAGEDAAYSPDGSRIATADNAIRIWDTATGALLLLLDDPDQTNYFPSFSPDGARIVVCGDWMLPRVWDATTGKVLLTLNYTANTRNPPWVAEFSPDGRRVLTTGFVSPPIQLWDAESGDELLTLPGSAICARFSPDGARIVTVDRDPNTDERWVAVYDSRPTDRAVVPAPAPRPKE